MTPRLIFALDATASRQPTWDTACQLQAEMFRAVPAGLDVQLVYYRSLNECRASRWVSSGERLAQLMSRIKCQAGVTQIGRVLAHAGREAEKAKVRAMVFIGDAMEENIDELAAAAGPPRCLLAVRCRRCPTTSRTVGGGCGLCGGRGQGPVGSDGCSDYEAPGATEIATCDK